VVSEREIKLHGSERSAFLIIDVPVIARRKGRSIRMQIELWRQGNSHDETEWIIIDEGSDGVIEQTVPGIQKTSIDAGQ